MSFCSYCNKETETVVLDGYTKKVVEHYEDEINYYSELLANIREA